MTSKYWRGPHGLTHPKSFVALTWEKSLVFWLFQESWDNVYVSLKHAEIWWCEQLSLDSHLMWLIQEREPLPNDNIKYSELQFNWYGCLMSCDNVSIMKRVLECCQTNLLDRVMSEWSGCASPSVTKALPFLTSCEPPDTQHVLHFLLVSLRSPTPSLSLKWPATDANSNRLPWGPKVWDYIEMIGIKTIKTGSKVLGFQRNGTTNSHKIYNTYYRFLTTRSSGCLNKINQMSQWIKRETNQILRYVSIQLFTQIMQII